MTIWGVMADFFSHARTLGMIIIVVVIVVAYLARVNSDTMQGILNTALAAGVAAFIQGVTNANNLKQAAQSDAQKGGKQ